MEKFNHDGGEMVQTMYVVRNGEAYRINVADYDGKELISHRSHFVPDGATNVEANPDDAADDKGGTGKGKGKGGKAAPAAGPTLVGTPKAWQGPQAGTLVYSQAGDDGKFYRVDAGGAILLATAFATDGEAAGAVIPPA